MDFSEGHHLFIKEIEKIDISISILLIVLLISSNKGRRGQRADSKHVCIIFIQFLKEIFSILINIIPSFTNQIIQANVFCLLYNTTREVKNSPKKL